MLLTFRLMVAGVVVTICALDYAIRSHWAR